MKAKKIEDYQLRELEEKKILINKYDLGLKYNYELTPYWKELYFDILDLLTENDYEFHLDFLAGGSLYNYMIKNWKRIIKEYDLELDIRDYVEIDDYISLQNWQKDTNNGIGYFADGIYLISKD